MNSDIHWLKLVLGVILFLRMDLVASDPVCSDDYWPCTCEVIKTSAGCNQLRISCNQIRNVKIVQAVFERTPSVDVHSFYMTILHDEYDDIGFYSNIPRNFFYHSRIRNIYLTCDRIPYLKIDRNAFSSSKLFLEHFHIDNCDMGTRNTNSYYDWDMFTDFKFLKSLTFSKTKNFYNSLLDFPLLFSLTTLNMTHSNNFEKLLGHLDDFDEYTLEYSDKKFPNLVNLVMNYCPNITAKVMVNPDGFVLTNRDLKTVTMNGNQMSDLVAENILKKFFSVRSLSFMNNDLTRLPNITKFPNLTHLKLDNNNLTSENFSLAQLNGSGLQTLTLSSCGLKNIKPGALEVDSNRFQLKLLDLVNNHMTRFESSVFQGILQKMANRWEDPGVIHVHRNSFDCDCHLAWLIVDNRHLLRHVRGAKCSDGLPFTKLTSSQFAACNATSGQLKPSPFIVI